MVVILIILGIVAYAAIGGATCALFYWLYPWQAFEGDEYVIASIAWPVGLPIVGSHALAKKLFHGIDEKRAAAAKEAAELKRRVAELDEELRVSRGGKA